MKKIKLIKEITEFHPSLGVKHGLSRYTGGMADTGHWFEGTLLSLKKKSLKRLLNELQKELDKKSLNSKPLGKHSGVIALLSDGRWYFQQEIIARDKFEDFLEKHHFINYLRK